MVLVHDIRGMRAEIREESEEILISNAICTRVAGGAVLKCKPKPIGFKPKESLEIQSKPLERV